MSTQNRLGNYFGSAGFARWCAEIDVRVEEDFFAMLDVFQRNLAAGDSYAAQMRDMGFCFDDGKERPALFVDCLRYLLQESVLTGAVFQPVKMFRRKGERESDNSNKNESKAGGRRGGVLVFDAPPLEKENAGSCSCNCSDDGENVFYVANLFNGRGIGCYDNESLETTNLLKPDVFVLLLANGFFPIGDPTRELTNQTLSAHDLAHIAGFLIAPEYAQGMLCLFRHVYKMLQQGDTKLAAALENFDSYYSLRLYYLIEVIAKVRNVPLLERVLGFSVDTFPLGATAAEAGTVSARTELERMLAAKTPVERIQYMRGITKQFHNIILPLGGESRDILNRKRKQKRNPFIAEGRKDLYSAANSKFAQNSIYSLYYDVKEAIEECRSSHPHYLETVTKLFATFLAALIGTAQLSLTDWIEGSMSPVPSQSTALYAYVDGLFDNKHLFWKAFCSPRYDMIAK